MGDNKEMTQFEQLSSQISNLQIMFRDMFTRIDQKLTAIDDDVKRINEIGIRNDANHKNLEKYVYHVEEEMKSEFKLIRDRISKEVHDLGEVAEKTAANQTDRAKSDIKLWILIPILAIIVTLLIDVLKDSIFKGG